MKTPPLDVGAAQRLTNANRCNLKDVVFVTINATHVSSAPDGALTLDWDIPPITAVWELSAGWLKAMFPMSLFIDAYSDDTPAARTRVAEVSVIFRIDYLIRNDDEASHPNWMADIPHYVGICGYLHAWPYFRSEVQWLTTKLGLPPLVLPVVVSGEAANRVSVRSASEVQGEISAAVKRVGTAKQSKKPTKPVPKSKKRS